MSVRPLGQPLALVALAWTLACEVPIIGFGEPCSEGCDDGYACDRATELCVPTPEGDEGEGEEGEGGEGEGPGEEGEGEGEEGEGEEGEGEAPPANRAPLAFSRTIVAATDDIVTTLLEARDRDGDSLTFSLEGILADGLISGNGDGTVTFESPPFATTALVGFVVSDGELEDRGVIHLVTIDPAGTPLWIEGTPPPGPQAFVTKDTVINSGPVEFQQLLIATGAVVNISGVLTMSSATNEIDLVVGGALVADGGLLVTSNGEIESSLPATLLAATTELKGPTTVDGALDISALTGPLASMLHATSLTLHPSGTLDVELDNLVVVDTELTLAGGTLFGDGGKIVVGENFVDGQGDAQLSGATLVLDGPDSTGQSVFGGQGTTFRDIIFETKGVATLGDGDNEIRIDGDLFVRNGRTGGASTVVARGLVQVTPGATLNGNLLEVGGTLEAAANGYGVITTMFVPPANEVPAGLHFTNLQIATGATARGQTSCGTLTVFTDGVFDVDGQLITVADELRTDEQSGLIMDDPGDVVVARNVVLAGSISNFSAGTLFVQGSFKQQNDLSGASFNASQSHTVVFDGDRVLDERNQDVELDNSLLNQFHTMHVTTLAGIKLQSNVTANTVIVDGDVDLNGFVFSGQSITFNDEATASRGDSGLGSLVFANCIGCPF